jgi:hypothetical protein
VIPRRFSHPRLTSSSSHRYYPTDISEHQLTLQPIMMAKRCP